MVYVGLVFMLVAGLKWTNGDSLLLNHPISCINGPINQTLVTLYENCYIWGIVPTGQQCPPIKFFSQEFAKCYWCYGKYGFFEVGGPFISEEHPISVALMDPDVMNLTMDLYTRENPNDRYVFLPDDIRHIHKSPFNPDHKTILLVGGFTNGDFSPMDKVFRDALFANDDYNIFVVNWKNGSGKEQLDYKFAGANARLAGAEAAYFISLIMLKYHYPLCKVHVIAISLGCHLAGYIGERLPGLGRISGLDPAGPRFINADPRVRLDPSDAKLVDVTHTNAGGLGITHNCGDLDFYPNGGSIQPSCGPPGRTLATSTAEQQGCDHVMSAYYYIPTINNVCHFDSVMCDSFANLDKCSCSEDHSRCARMGFHADEYRYPTPTKEPFFLATKPTPPYCLS